ncbi:hypothetical protein PAP_05330 [Palaeococcus pacificus DY20341]|uniref:Uncharacterized protein n=1 Tax=Palaeococcus pacificus DY20341 TaxID=1343739 RepID=A0A075LU33_9EURY|nr:hypothetical protein [Palaeococcus pacificus]AIF69472.1 hypothetical protein PAP_05330 [Palaeococcus pacificus DY20341]
MLLTNHAKERIAKRLSKRRKLDRIYSSLWAFLEKAHEIKVNEKVSIFTDKRKSLVCVKLNSKILTLEELKEEVSKINDAYECVFFGDEKFAKITLPKKFLSEIEDGVYHFYISKEKKALYIGEVPPFLVITLRPAKRHERGMERPDMSE